MRTVGRWCVRGRPSRRMLLRSVVVCACGRPSRRDAAVAGRWWSVVVGVRFVFCSDLSGDGATTTTRRRRPDDHNDERDQTTLNQPPQPFHQPPVAILCTVSSLER